jgi:hypothetical protein
MPLAQNAECGNNRGAAIEKGFGSVQKKQSREQDAATLMENLIPVLVDSDDNRSITDRRRFSWRTVAYGFLRSRRRTHRRDEECEPIFTDWHHPWLFFLAVGIMLMSSMDAFLTLRLIDLGATEVNPVMAALMGEGTMAFAASKMLLTGLSILTLVFLAKARAFNRFRIGTALTVVFNFYCCLICYEFVLLIGQH